MDVGVRELKAKLSEYLAAAAAGDDVVVTDRGRPIVRLVPFGNAATIELMSNDPVLATSRIAEQTLSRSFDALHVASALRAGASTTLLTFDVRQARTARAMGLSVLGC